MIECPKCGYEHTPDGVDDGGEWECASCGFEFVVDITYEPHYDTRCKKCEYGSPFVKVVDGDLVILRSCVHCGDLKGLFEKAETGA